MVLLDVMNEMSVADAHWIDAIRLHAWAPPDDGFASRLRSFADAARMKAEALRHAEEEGGIFWEPYTLEEVELLPYELTPNSGRVGPEALWEQFDHLHADYVQAMQQEQLSPIRAAFAGLGDIAAQLAEAVDRLRGKTPAVPGNGRERKSA